MKVEKENGHYLHVHTGRGGLRANLSQHGRVG